jgi:hypothetical protein
MPESTGKRLSSLTKHAPTESAGDFHTHQCGTVFEVASLI